MPMLNRGGLMLAVTSIVVFTACIHGGTPIQDRKITPESDVHQRVTRTPLASDTITDKVGQRADIRRIPRTERAKNKDSSAPLDIDAGDQLSEDVNQDGHGGLRSYNTRSTASSFTITSPLCEDGQGPTCRTLRLGDDFLTTSNPAKGYLYSCNGKNPNAPGSIASKITWINAADKTWDFFKKLWLPEGTFRAEPGTYTETVTVDARKITVNNLPVDGKIGDWPMTDYPILTEIDRNPSIPGSRHLEFSYDNNPVAASSPICVALGAIGVTKNGVVIYNAVDGRGEDAAAREIVDVFGGHPAGTDYHYHFIPERLDSAHLSNGHSGVVGYINDGFPIYGYKGDGGVEMSNNDLDLCHGHNHGALGYHYHATVEYPYTVGCYMGTPRASLSGNGGLSERGVPPDSQIPLHR